MLRRLPGVELEQLRGQRQHGPGLKRHAHPHGWRRGALAVVAGVLACMLAIEAIYLVFAATVLPRRVQDEFHRAGVELTFDELRSWFPTQIALEAVVLRGDESWAVRAEQVVAAMGFDEGWRVQRVYASGVSLDGEARAGPFELRLDMPTATSAGHSSLVGDDVSGSIGKWVMQMDVHVAGRIEQWSAEEEIRIGDMGVTLSGLDLSSLTSSSAASQTGGTEPLSAAESRSGVARVNAHLDVQSASISAGQGASIQGAVMLTGTDAGIWLDLAGAGGALRWMLSDIIGQPFTARGQVHARDGWLSVEQVELEIGPSRAQGALRTDGDRIAAAFLVRRGSSAIGITISEAGVSVRAMADPAWLTLHLHELQRSSRR